MSDQTPEQAAILALLARVEALDAMACKQAEVSIRTNDRIRRTEQRMEKLMGVRYGQ